MCADRWVCITGRRGTQPQPSPGSYEVRTTNSTLFGHEESPRLLNPLACSLLSYKVAFHGTCCTAAAAPCFRAAGTGASDVIIETTAHLWCHTTLSSFMPVDAYTGTQSVEVLSSQDQDQ